MSDPAPPRPHEGYGDLATRHRILDATWRLIEEGAPDVTMAQVAAAAGVSRQAVYLHFESRSGLLVGLVRHVDEQLGLAELAAPVQQATTGREALAAMVELHADYTARIIGVARLLDAARLGDPAVAAAWEDRMSGRRRAHRRIVERLERDGDLAPGWAVEDAALLFYTWTLPRVWDELVTERGWSTDDFREHVTRALTGAFVAER